MMRPRTIWKARHVQGWHRCPIYSIQGHGKVGPQSQTSLPDNRCAISRFPKS